MPKDVEFFDDKHNRAFSSQEDVANKLESFVVPWIIDHSFGFIKNEKQVLIALTTTVVVFVAILIIVSASPEKIDTTKGYVPNF